MGGKKLTWLFELFDKMSAPASRMAKALERLKKLLGGSKKETEGQEKANRKLGDSFVWLGAKLSGWIYLARTALSAVAGLARGIGGLAFSFGRAAVEAGSFRETAGLGLGILLGGRAQGDRVLRQAVRFASVTPFETKATMGWVRDLVAAGFGENELWNVLKGAGDLAALRDFDPQVIDRVIMAFRQIRGKGRLQGEELLQLAEIGLPIGEVYETLAKKLRVSPFEVSKLQTQGQISADAGIWAVLEVIRNRISGGRLGNVMQQMSGTVPGLLSTVKSRPFELMMDLDKSPGFASFKEFLRNLASVLDPETPQGQRIKKNVEDLFNRLMGGFFDKFKDPKVVEEWVRTLLEGLEKLIPKIGEMADKVGRFAADLRSIVRTYETLTSPIETFEKIDKGTVQVTPQAEAIKHLRRLYGKASLGPIERDELLLWEKWARERGVDPEQVKAGVRGTRPPAPAGQPSPPMGFRLEKGAIQMDIHGASDPKAVADEVEERLSSLFERLAAETGAA